MHRANDANESVKMLWNNNQGVLLGSYGAFEWESALERAVLQDRMDVLTLCCEEGVQKSRYDYEPALMAALEKNSLEALELLYAKCTTDSVENALKDAVSSDKWNAVKVL
jgi:hypothetical protein